MSAAHPVILVVNAGSSSVKVSVYVVPESAHENVDIQPELAAHGQIEGIGVAPRLVARMADGRVVADERFPVEQVADHDAAFRLIRLTLSVGLRDTPPVAIGHRVVHGGADFTDAVRIDDDVIARLEALVPLAPLHQPHNLTAIRAVRGAVPDLLQVACFDTAFHAGHDPLAQLMALPYEYFERGIRRYGFHGLSYAYIARRLRQVAPELAEGRVVVAHLGNGASLCAMRGGRSVESTMGLTALDGMPMGTRCGSIDPGAVLWLAAQGMDGLPDHVPNHELQGTDARYPLAMISPPARNFLNSTFVNVKSLRTIEGRPLLEMHPDDAAARGIADGSTVRVFNDRGSYECHAEVSTRARPGVVNGLGIWWRKLGLNGTNVNEVTSQALTDLGRAPTFYDCLVEVEASPNAAA